MGDDDEVALAAGDAFAVVGDEEVAVGFAPAGAVVDDGEAVDGDALSATSLSRKGSAGGPLLLTPSPETSTTLRVVSKGDAARVSALKRRAPERLVQEMLDQGLAWRVLAQFAGVGRRWRCGSRG